MASAATGIQKSLDRINAQVVSGAFYEAQQMYKTVYHRCKARRQAEDSYTVLQAGAVTQLSNQQLTCGVELANMLIDAFVADSVKADAQHLGMVYAVLRALPDSLQLGDPESTAELDELSRWVMAALKWAHKQGADDDVHTIHDVFAGWIWRAYGWRQFSKAALHYSRGADAAAYASALEAVSSQAGSSAEEDLFIARAVLQTLACAHAQNAQRQRQHAAALLEACKAVQPSVTQQPLVRFCELLLQALQLHKQQLLALLRGSYGPSLQVDPSFEAYLDTIEQVYFNVRPAGGGGGLLGGLLRGLLEGDEMDDS
ncbi:hypothetical protein COO60DRAFT_1624749 [Scenedesmus sp. NREL 46B-D3]|nr:hypothetical protein COO60DRAFT_1624749 [Scenedesmus sp. NREL 46B-D3]